MPRHATPRRATLARPSLFPIVSFRPFFRACPFIKRRTANQRLFPRSHAACRINSSPPLSPTGAPEAAPRASTRTTLTRPNRLNSRLISWFESLSLCVGTRVAFCWHRVNRDAHTSPLLFCGKSTRRKFRIQPSVHRRRRTPLYYNRACRTTRYCLIRSAVSTGGYSGFVYPISAARRCRKPRGPCLVAHEVGTGRTLMADLMIPPKLIVRFYAALRI